MFEVLPGMGACTMICSSFFLLPCESLFTAHGWTGLCQSPRPSTSARNEIASTEGIFLPESLSPRLMKSAKKISLLLGCSTQPDV